MEEKLKIYLIIALVLLIATIIQYWARKMQLYKQAFSQPIVISTSLREYQKDKELFFRKSLNDISEIMKNVYDEVGGGITESKRDIEKFVERHYEKVLRHYEEHLGFTIHEARYESFCYYRSGIVDSLVRHIDRS